MKARTWWIIIIGVAIMLMTYAEGKKDAEKKQLWTGDNVYETAAFEGEFIDDSSYEAVLAAQAGGTEGLRRKSEKKSSIWPVFLIGGIVLALYISGWSLLQNTGFMFIAAGIVVLALLMR